MNVLDLAKTVAYKVGVAPPSALFGSTHSLSLRMIALLYDQARYLRNQRVFPQQKKSATITTVNGDDLYPLATDFYATLPGTQYDNQLEMRMEGPLSDANMNDRIYGGAPNTTPAYRVFGVPVSTGNLQIKPTPTEDNLTYTYDYITKYMFFSSAWASGSETIAADTDLCIFDDDIMVKGVEWRFRESKGQQYQEQKAEHDKMVDSAVARWQATYRGSFGGNEWDGPRYSVPNGSWG